MFHHVFIYMGELHFDNDATSNIDYVLTEHGGLLHILPLPVHLILRTIRGDHYETFLFFEYLGPLLHGKKLWGGGGGWWPKGF